MHYAVVAATLVAALFASPVRAESVENDFRDVLSCQTDPGRALCREMRRLDSYMVNCDGLACYDLWRDQLRSMEDLTDRYYDVDPSASAEPALGRMAAKLSKSICNTQWTGDPTFIQRIGIAANRALKALNLLQLAANEPLPYTCTLVVNRQAEDMHVLAR